MFLGGLNLLIRKFGVHGQLFPESFIGIEFVLCVRRSTLDCGLRELRRISIFARVRIDLAS